MPLFARRPPLPPELTPAWERFLDCAAVVEGGVRQLLACLPVGRVEPAPIGVGVDALANAVEDARAWMPAWRFDELRDDWEDALAALDGAEAGLDDIREVAATSSELEELQETILGVVGPLDVFADVEREWRRRWRVPRDTSLHAG